MDLLSLLFLLSFVGSCAGDVILPDGPVDEILGKNVTIKTLVDKPNYAFIVWVFNDGKEEVHIATVSEKGLKVNEPYAGRVSINPTNGYLSLGPLKASDSGEYGINIISPDGATKTGMIELRVLEPVSSVAIKSDLPEAIEHNSTVVLTCSAKGSFLKFAWINGTAPIVADGKRLTVKDEELSSTLTIAGVLRSELAGPIFCTATNKMETEKSAPFNLTVYYGPDEVAITPLNPPKVVRAKSNFNLSCSVTSSPAATFTWYHGQQMMEIAGPVLTLEIIEKHGLGKTEEQYTCRANNEKTLRTVSSPAVSFSVMDAISGVTITGPTAVLLAGNSSANISCQATSGIVNTVTWLKDGKALPANARLVFANDKSSLSINPVQKEDNGQYTCQLGNPVNQEQASYKMVVNYGPEPVTVSGNNAVEVNDEVTLTCSADSVPPANFTWKFNQTVTDVKTATYTIPKAVYKNSGMYTCEAYNAITGKTTMLTHTLSVKEEGALDPDLSDGAIAGIVIAVLVALAAAIGLIVYCRQKVPVESPY
ncbi:cell adhesion molecule CEACAM20 isoform X1 [Chaetodon trifascialis]|uniref:cell adhesion molecule CEACAM20 isoform X1 n=1 Tax=Chaetodon trifascialis TaxID=109706 RepID=UPI0039933B3A